MDLQSALIGLGGFVVSAAVLLLISMFGMKEKSYEEAVAEQRKQTNELLGVQHRPKPKDKKQQKKAGKKVKEKKASPTTETETAEESENTDAQASDSNGHHAKHHVEFKEATVIEEPSREAPTKRRQKKDKVRPILVNRDSSAENIIEVSADTLPASNHFEESHPKDDCELLHSHQLEEKNAHANNKETEKKKNKHNIENEPPAAPQPPQRTNKKSNKQQLNEVVAPKAAEKEEPVVEVVPIPQQQNNTVLANANTGKEKKKKKSELNTIQQLAGDKHGVNLSALLPLVAKAEMSRSEVQILINMLLNKQHETPAIMDEWSEGKADPVQKLKRQLAEKEKALTEEQEALVGAQAKLREVRAEQNMERSQLQQRVRALEEALHVKLTEVQASNAKGLMMNQKMQQMQAQLNDEAMKARQLIEEHNALQMQWQQMELRLQHTQEADLTIVQLRSELQDTLAANNELTIDIHAIKENNKEQHQELMQAKQLHQQMEESFGELEHRLDQSMRQETEYKTEMQQMKTSVQQYAEEVRRLEHNSAQTVGEIHSLQKHKDELQRTITQLRSEFQSVQEEKAKLQQAKINGSVEENKTHQVELLNLHNQLSSVKSQLQQAHEIEMETVVKNMKAEVDAQKAKNNELRQRNWKVMDALNVAESRNKSLANQSILPTSSMSEEIVSKIRLEEQQDSRKLFNRLFPEIEWTENVPQEKWFSEIAKVIEQRSAELAAVPETPKSPDRGPEILKLQSTVKHYKTIIDDTEGMLNKLQKHIEQEEINWRTQLKSKDSQIEALKEQTERVTVAIANPPTPESQGVQFAYACIEKSLPSIINELTMQLAELEEKFIAEQTVKDKLMGEYESLKNECKKMGDISQQVDRLREELLVEQRKNAEFMKQNAPTKTQNHNSTTNGPSVAIERTLSTTSSTASSVTEVLVNKKNKKKKKKNNGK